MMICRRGCKYSGYRGGLWSVEEFEAGKQRAVAAILVRQHAGTVLGPAQERAAGPFPELSLPAAGACSRKSQSGVAPREGCFRRVDGAVAPSMSGCPSVAPRPWAFAVLALSWPCPVLAAWARTQAGRSDAVQSARRRSSPGLAQGVDHTGWAACLAHSVRAYGPSAARDGVQGARSGTRPAGSAGGVDEGR